METSDTINIFNTKQKPLMKGNPSSVIYRYIRLDFVTINQVVILDYTIIILGGGIIWKQLSCI